MDYLLRDALHTGAKTRFADKYIISRARASAQCLLFSHACFLWHHGMHHSYRDWMRHACGMPILASWQVLLQPCMNAEAHLPWPMQIREEDGELAWDHGLYYMLMDLFSDRAHMHQRVYKHKCVGVVI